MKSDETDDDPSSTRVTSRSAYTSLSDKKKLKFIKKAEQNYDSYDVRYSVINIHSSKHL